MGRATSKLKDLRAAAAAIDKVIGPGVRRAVAELRSRGIATYHMENGKYYRTAPNGSRTEISVVLFETKDELS